MSRLTDLIAAVRAKDSVLGRELEREFQVLSSRRSFGLNFERHRPESVELAGRPIRRGDKVRILPLRGTTAKTDRRLWKVLGFETLQDARMAQLDTSRNPAVRGRDGRAAVGRARRGGIAEITRLMDAFWGEVVVRPAVSGPTSVRPCC